jgi:hypothetical protein
MCWAAYRETSRVEDLAYCLLGIFQINMPLLYGEGRKAFSRLQEEILKSSTDLSLLAWSQDPGNQQQFRGIFSYHPREFRGLRECQLDNNQFSVREEIIMTNKGARIDASLFCQVSEGIEPWPLTDMYFLFLGCYVDGYPQGIFLKTMQEFHVRSYPDELIRINESMRRSKSRIIYLARDFDEGSNREYHIIGYTGIVVKFKTPENYILKSIESWPNGFYDELSDAFLVGHLPTFVGYILVALSDSAPTRRQLARFMVVICKGGPSNVLVNLLNEDQEEKFQNDIKLASERDPITARKDLAVILAHMWMDNKELEIVVNDNTTNSLLHVEANVVNRGQTVSIAGDTFPLKAVNISVGVDS